MWYWHTFSFILDDQRQNNMSTSEVNCPPFPSKGTLSWLNRIRLPWPISSLAGFKQGQSLLALQCKTALKLVCRQPYAYTLYQITFFFSKCGRGKPVLLYDDGYSEGLKEHWRSTYWNETMHDQASLSLLLRPSYRRVETLTHPQDCHHLVAWKKKIALKLSGAVVSYQKI